MQCCQFEMVLAYTRLRVSEAGLGRHYHRLELADLLMDRGVTTIDRLPEVEDLVRSLEPRFDSAA